MDGAQCPRTSLRLLGRATTLYDLLQDSPHSDADGSPEPGREFDWSARYASADTPWDLGGPHPELSLRLQDGSLAPPHEGARALVPGCGHGHDAVALARRGWAVTALDVVESLGADLAPQLEKLGGQFLVRDVLGYDEDGAFDLIWDHTFFCAIDPGLRSAWGERANRLLKPGGQYAALVFPVGKPEADGGPPFGMDGDALMAALGRLFRQREAERVSRPLKRRTWQEYWLLAEKASLRASS